MQPLIKRFYIRYVLKVYSVTKTYKSKCTLLKN